MFPNSNPPSRTPFRTVCNLHLHLSSLQANQNTRLPRSLIQRSTRIVVIASYSTWFVGSVMKVPMRKLHGSWPWNLVMLPTLFPTFIHAILLSRDLTPIDPFRVLGLILYKILHNMAFPAVCPYVTCLPPPPP